MEEMENLKERAEKVTKDANQDTKGLKGPLVVAIAENKELKRQMSNYDRDKASLAVSIYFYYFAACNSSSVIIKVRCNVHMQYILKRS